MDELSLGPPRWAAAALAGLAVVLAVLAALGDPLGALMLGLAAVLAFAAAAWVAGPPALRADDAGLRVRGLLRTHVVPWAEVAAVLVDDRRRSRALEVETTDRLLAVPAVLLGGVSPSAAAERLARLRPARPAP